TLLSLIRWLRLPRLHNSLFSLPGRRMATEAPQRCLYEILGVERSSSAEEIRAAYRKLALKLHPDKNTNKGEEEEAAGATARFQELQRAYELLSDPRERSWYDSHRSQILFSSSQSSSNAKFADFDINLWPYFSTCAYSGYGDTAKGFFRVYGELFEKLFQQEIAFAHATGEGTVAEAPLIGNLESPYPQVSAFYKYWLGFCTIKDFAWVDEYRASAGPNRKLRRLMEEENKKHRKKAKREYNEAVRELAEFVKKRDTRVLDRQLEKKRESEEKLALANLRRKQLQMERLDKAARYREQEWTIPAEDDNDDDADAEYWGDIMKASDNQEFYCIVCSKKFKSEKQWKNHEQSKKHKDRLVELRDSFSEEDVIGIAVEVDALGSDIVSDHQIENEFNAEAQVDDLLIKMDRVGVHTPNSSDSEKDDQHTKNNAVRVFSNSKKTAEKEHPGSSACNGDLHEGSDESSSHKFADEENRNAEMNSSDENEIDYKQMDDEDSVLEAMLKTHRNKRKPNKVVWDAAQTENHSQTDNNDGNHNYSGNAEEYQVRKPTGFEPKSSNFVQRDTEGSSRPAQWQGSKKTAKEKKKQIAVSMKHQTTDIADGMESRSEGNEGAQQQEVVSNFNADKLEGDKEECPKSSAKQSIEQKSATSSTLAKKASSKGKKPKAMAKLPALTCDTCGKDFDS
ncbi:hypothetical protein KI387_023844, partial [Taxus chinensis]